MNLSQPRIVATKFIEGQVSFLDLPGELRNEIYTQILVSKNPNLTTYGSGSGIETAILRTSHTIYKEAIELLIGERHVLTCGVLKDRSRSSEQPPVSRDIPFKALASLRRITLQIIYETSVRGDCETEILRHSTLLYFTEAVAFNLRWSVVLESLRIELLNHSQRGRGQKRLRSVGVRQTMREILLPLAYLPLSKPVELTGFDTLDYAEMFEQMRFEYAGRERSYPDLLDEFLKK